MVPDLSFDVSWEQPQAGDALESATFSSLVIRLGGVPITEVRDDVARTTRDAIRVSAYPLALWFASAWWRLRWESQKLTSDWRMSHQLGSAGRGYVWPDVTFASDGEFVEVDVRRSPRVAWEPVSYLNPLKGSVPIQHFESQLAEFIEVVLSRLREMGHPDNDLAELWSTVSRERQDDDAVAARRLEATLGFDAGEAPPEILAGYEAGESTFGGEAVMELAAAASNGASPDWRALEESLNRGGAVRVERFDRLKHLVEEAVGALPAGSKPWHRGEAAARAVRRGLEAPQGPLTDDFLREWLGPVVNASGVSPLAASAVAHRAGADEPFFRLCYRSRHPEGRRFELARLLGDHLLAADAGDRLLPATRAKTARQRVQRAFAAELLVPFEDLESRLDDMSDSESVEAMAHEFMVSPLVVRTRLVTKGMLPSDALDRDLSDRD